MTELHKLMDAARAHLATLATKALAAGWKRSKFGEVTARSDAFSIIPAPAKARRDDSEAEWRSQVTRKPVANEERFDRRGLRLMLMAIGVGMAAGLWLVFGNAPSWLFGVIWVAFAVTAVGGVMHTRAFFRRGRSGWDKRN